MLIKSFYVKHRIFHGKICLYKIYINLTQVYYKFRNFEIKLSKIPCLNPVELEADFSAKNRLNNFTDVLKISGLYKKGYDKVHL